MHQPLSFPHTQAHTASEPPLVAVGIALLSAGLATLSALVSENQAQSSGLLLVVVVSGGTVLLFLAAARPVLGATVFIALTFVHPELLPNLAELGPFSFRLVDVVFAVLLAAAWLRPQTQGRLLSHELRRLYLPLLTFLGYVGLSLLNVALFMPSFLQTSLASYARLVATALFAVVLAHILRTGSDLTVLWRALVGLLVMTVAIGAWSAWADVSATGELLGQRFGGLVGTNSFGVASGLLVLYALLRKEQSPRSRFWLRWFGLGLSGLSLAKSAAAFLATAGAVSVLLSTPRAGRIRFPLKISNASGDIGKKRSSKTVSRLRRIFKWCAIGASLAAFAVAAVWWFRESDVSGLLSLSEGSFAQRTMIAFAGFQIFQEHILFGVGWQASATANVIGDPLLNQVVMERFPGLPVDYFFLNSPTSLHSMYLQFLAELGIVGFSLFVFSCYRVGREATRIVQSLPGASAHRLVARFCILGWVFLLIWWSFNALFGGQIESYLAFTFIGLLASVSRLEKERAAHQRLGQR